LSVKTNGIPGQSLHHLLPPYRSSNLHERGHSFHLPDYHTVLFKKCPLFIQICHSQLTNNLFLFVLFCVLPVCYDVCLLHLNKDYLHIYLLTYLLTWCYVTKLQMRRWRPMKGQFCPL